MTPLFLKRDQKPWLWQPGWEATFMCCVCPWRSATEALTPRYPDRTGPGPEGCLDLPLDAGGGPHGGPEAVPGAVHGTVHYRPLSRCPSKKRQAFTTWQFPAVQKHMASSQNLTCPQCNAWTWNYGSPEGTRVAESNISIPLSVLCMAILIVSDAMSDTDPFAVAIFSL